MKQELEIRFPMAVPKAPLAFAVVGTRPRETPQGGGPGAEEAERERDRRARDFACDQVIESWPLLTDLPLPLQGGDARFVFDIRMRDGDQASAMVFGSSANLACLIHLLRLASPAAWSRRTSDDAGAGPTHIWATGRVRQGELEKVNHLDEKLGLIASEAKTSGGAHWAFFSYGDVKWSDIATKSGVRILSPPGRPDPTLHSAPGVYLFLVPAKGGLRELVSWWLDTSVVVPPKPRWPRWVGAVAIAGVAAVLVWHFLTQTRPDPTVCHGFVNHPAETELAKTTSTQMAAGYKLFPKTAEARAHFAGVLDLARSELNAATNRSQRCLAETHVMEAHYYGAFVEYVYLAACARPGASCEPEMRSESKTRANTLLDVDLDRFLHNEATQVTQDHRRLALRDWLKVQIALRFTVTANATLIEAIEAFLVKYPCSDAQQTLLIELALLDEAAGDPEGARAAIARVAENLERVADHDLDCPLAAELPSEPRKQHEERFNQVNLLEASACYPDLSAAQSTKDVMCAVADVLEPGGGPLASSCTHYPTSHARATVALLRRGIAARTSGERWSLACQTP